MLYFFIGFLLAIITSVKRVPLPIKQLSWVVAVDIAFFSYVTTLQPLTQFCVIYLINLLVCYCVYRLEKKSC